MRKPVIAALSVAAIAAGGYSVAWYKVASTVKENVLQSLNKLNEQAKPLNGGVDALRYESLDMSGFPFAFKYTLTKPVLTVPMTSLMRLAPKENGAENEIAPDREWVEELQLGDSASYAADIMGSNFTLTTNGDRVLKALINGKERSVVTVSSSTPLVCHMHTTPAGFMQAQPALKDAESFFKALQSADCEGGATTAKDASGNVIASGSSHFVGYSNIVTNKERSFSLKWSSLGAKYTTAADAVLEAYLQIFSEVLGKKMVKASYSLSELGEANLKVDIAYKGPENMEALAPTASFRFDVNALDLTSSLFNSTTQVHVSTAPQANERSAELSIHSKTNVSERYDQALAENTKKTLEEMASTEGKTGPALDIALGMAKLGAPDTLVDALLPKFHQFGDMALDVDARVEGPNNAQALFLQGHSTVDALDITTTPYGVKTKGEFKGATGKAPSGSLNVTCANCDALIEDAGHYAIRFANYINTVEPLKKMNVPTPELLAGIRTFVHGIALNGADTNAKDLNFAVVMKDNGEVTVSGKQVMEVFQSYMTNVVANMPQRPAPQIPQDKLPPMLQQR